MIGDRTHALKGITVRFLVEGDDAFGGLGGDVDVELVAGVDGGGVGVGDDGCGVSGGVGDIRELVRRGAGNYEDKNRKNSLELRLGVSG